MVATTTECSARGRVRGGRRGSRPTSAGPDRLSVVLFTLAGFLVVLSLLAWQLGAGAKAHLRSVATIRRIYETRIVETVPGGNGGSSVTRSTSSSGSYASSAPATTRSS